MHASLPALLTTLCCATLALTAADTTGTLLFRSGYESGSTVVGQTTNGCDITGIDASVAAPNDWTKHLEADPLGTFNIQYQGGDATQRLASIATDPTQSTNKALRFWLKHANVDADADWGGKGRIQANLYGNTNLREIYYRTRMYLAPDFNKLITSTKPSGWLIFAEFWNDPNWIEGMDGFRIHLAADRQQGKGLSLHVNAEDTDANKKWIPAWSKANSQFLLPIGAWFTMEVWFKEGDAKTGRFAVRITEAGKAPTLVFDITNRTYSAKTTTPDGLSHVNPLKLYTHHDNIDIIRDAGGVMQVLWDDLELWRDRGLDTAAVNVPPAVTITSPTTGATLTAPATIELAAAASDSDGTIAKVEFLDGSAKLGEDTTSPYAFTWTDVVAGTYTLTVRATDNQGATATATQSLTVAAPPALAQLGSGRTEAESLTLDGMEASDDAASSGGQIVKILATGATAGTARAAFSGATGQYDLTVGYIDEGDGAGTWSLLVDGVTVSSWTGALNTGNGSTSLWQHLEHRATNISLNIGSVIAIAGTLDQGEFCRTDWIDIQAATPPPAPLVAPTQFTGIADGGTVSLFWVDRSDDETGFRIERAGADGIFAVQATVAAGTERWTQTGLALGTYAYRLRAVRGETLSDPVLLNVSVVTAGAGDGIPDSGASTGCGGGSGVAGLLALLALGLRRRRLD